MRQQEGPISGLIRKTGATDVRITTADITILVVAEKRDKVAGQRTQGGGGM